MRFTLLFFALIFINVSASKSQSGGDGSLAEPKKNTDRFYDDRIRMVDYQIARRGVNDSLVIDAMRCVPRHLFVPENYRDRSYEDGPLPIGENQTISQPYIVALMTELLELNGGEKVLEVGTGSGYQAAVLAEICDSVYTIEIIKSLADRARYILDSIGYNNVKVIYGDGYQGWPEAAPFDGIIVTAAPDHIPQPLIDQLAIGGKLVIPVGDYYQYLKVLTKTEDGVDEQTGIAVRFVPMTGKVREK
jgi:protein-L-isoaspartate(D-aspartate) O-methyltransferase